MAKFFNTGLRGWGLALDQVFYGDEPVTQPSDTFPRYAGIDTANYSIALPPVLYDQFLTELKKAETKTIKFSTKDMNGHQIIFVDKKYCSSVRPKL